MLYNFSKFTSNFVNEQVLYYMTNKNNSHERTQSRKNQSLDIIYVLLMVTMFNWKYSGLQRLITGNSKL